MENDQNINGMLEEIKRVTRRAALQDAIGVLEGWITEINTPTNGKRGRKAVRAPRAIPKTSRPNGKCRHEGADGKHDCRKNATGPRFGYMCIDHRKPSKAPKKAKAK